MVCSICQKGAAHFYKNLKVKIKDIDRKILQVMKRVFSTINNFQFYFFTGLFSFSFLFLGLKIASILTATTYVASMIVLKYFENNKDKKEDYLSFKKGVEQLFYKGYIPKDTKNALLEKYDNHSSNKKDFSKEIDKLVEKNAISETLAYQIMTSFDHLHPDKIPFQVDKRYFFPIPKKLKDRFIKKVEQMKQAFSITKQAGDVINTEFRGSNGNHHIFEKAMDDLCNKKIISSAQGFEIKNFYSELMGDISDVKKRGMIVNHDATKWLNDFDPENPDLALQKVFKQTKVSCLSGYFDVSGTPLQISPKYHNKMVNSLEAVDVSIDEVPDLHDLPTEIEVIKDSPLDVVLAMKNKKQKALLFQDFCYQQGSNKLNLEFTQNDLFLRSDLFLAIDPLYNKRMNEKKNKDALYAKGIQVFRTGDSAGYGFIAPKRIDAVLCSFPKKAGLEKIRNILRIAKQKEYENIVLDMNLFKEKNRSSEWKQVLKEAEFQGKFRKICFVDGGENFKSYYQQLHGHRFYT